MDFNTREIQFLKQALRQAYDKAMANCSTWKNSGDRGACVQYEAMPYKHLLNKVEDYERSNQSELPRETSHI